MFPVPPPMLTSPAATFIPVKVFIPVLLMVIPCTVLLFTVLAVLVAALNEMPVNEPATAVALPVVIPAILFDDISDWLPVKARLIPVTAPVPLFCMLVAKDVLPMLLPV